ncbi:MAG TPA: hypothetical protein VGM43_05065 [Bryobacteraceae bacterium]|jgi:hypothetical protein
MSARLLATLVCVLNSVLCFGQAAPVDPPEHRVLVYLSNDSGQSSQILDRMKREVGSLMEPAGYSVLWQVSDGSSASVSEVKVVIMELRGVCRPLATVMPFATVVNGASLASSVVEDGQVLPFTRLDCAMLSNFLAPYLPHQTDQRNLLFGQAMGRLAAHELFHTLTKTKIHEDIGVAKESFSAANLLGERFSFDFPAIIKFRDSAPARTAEMSDAEEDHVSVGR